MKVVYPFALSCALKTHVSNKIRKKGSSQISSVRKIIELKNEIKTRQKVHIDETWFSKYE